MAALFISWKEKSGLGEMVIGIAVDLTVYHTEVFPPGEGEA